MPRAVDYLRFSAGVTVVLALLAKTAFAWEQPLAEQRPIAVRPTLQLPVEPAEVGRDVAFEIALAAVDGHWLDRAGCRWHVDSLELSELGDAFRAPLTTDS